MEKTKTVKKAHIDMLLALLSSLGIFYLFDNIYIKIYEIMTQSGGYGDLVLEFMKLSPLLTEIPSFIIGLILWRGIKISKTFNKWFILVLSIEFTVRILSHLIWLFKLGFI